MLLVAAKRRDRGYTVVRPQTSEFARTIGPEKELWSDQRTMQAAGNNYGAPLRNQQGIDAYNQYVLFRARNEFGATAVAALEL
jgi:hypothetical protein